MYTLTLMRATLTILVAYVIILIVKDLYDEFKD